MTERMAPMQRKTKAVIPQRIALPKIPVLVDPLAVQRRAVHEQTHRPVAVQHQLVQPVLRAAELSRQEVGRVEQVRGPLQRQAAELASGLPEQALTAAIQRQVERSAPVQAPVRPQTPADWVTVMRAQAQSLESKNAGSGLNSRELAQHTALQRQVSQALVQGYKQDRGPAAERQASYADQLVSLQRHVLTAPVARSVLALLPAGERPALQRAVDVALQREEAQQTQDRAAFHLHTVQRQLAELEHEATRPVFERIQARRGAGNPLPEAIQRHLEQGLNHDLSQVRIHDDAEADQLSKKVNATAFTTGQDIYFRSGQFNPNTRSGLELLAHEVTHATQQAQGKVGRGVDPDAGLESEAQRMGAKLASQPLQPLGGGLRPVKASPGVASQQLQRQRGAGLTDDVVSLQKRLKTLNADMALTMTQAAADVAGIVDPTPISDGISAAISLYRGDFLGAGLSLLSMIPGLGDAIAKPIKGSKLGIKIAGLEKEIRLVTQRLAQLSGKNIGALQTAARASRKVVATEVLTRLPKNWGKIRGLLGKKYNKSMLPPDYFERIVNGQVTIVRKAGKADDALVAPLGIDRAGRLMLKQGTQRLSSPARMRSNFKAAFGREARPGHQIHHLVPDNLIRNHPLGQAAERLGVSLDRGTNLVDLPGKVAHTAGDVGHWSSHPGYDGIVKPLLDAAQAGLERQFGSLDAVPPQMMTKTMDAIASRLRTLIQRKQVPLKPDGRLAAAPATERPATEQTA